MNKWIITMGIIVMTALMVVFSAISIGNTQERPDSNSGEEPKGLEIDLSRGHAILPEGRGFAEGHILVKFRPGADIAEINAKLNGKAIDVIPQINVHIIGIHGAMSAEEMVGRFNQHPHVEYAELDQIAYVVLMPNDPHFSKQWGLNNTGQTGGTSDADINACEAWDMTTGAASVNIAILDTGIDQTHEDLQAKITANKNFTSSRTVDDKYGHGTHVAGIAAAITNNGKGIAGTGYSSGLMNVKVLGDRGSGFYSWIAQGIIWAADNNARVINLSLGGSQVDKTLENAVNYAWSKGVVLVAAAGNNNVSTKLYPAAYPNCIAVAATDHNDQKASFSNYGADWVDVAAGGVNIYSTLPDHKNTIGKLYYDYLSGTSMATPFVSGTAGLVWTTGYGYGNSSVRNRIESTCNTIAGTGSYFRYGRVNAYEAVK